MSGRDEIREKEAAIGNVGEVQAVLTGQAFGFVEGADCVYGCWEELERGNGNVGSRVGEALGRNQRYLFNCRGQESSMGRDLRSEGPGKPFPQTW